MYSFHPAILEDLTIPVATSWLLAVCMEGKGRQELWFQTKPELLESLRQLAIVQIAESSNRIEGVTVARQRLQPLLLAGERPLDRSEEELVGYRKALDWIHSSHADIKVDPRSLTFR